MAWPIRARLTAWYTAIFAAATIALAVASFYLVARSAREAADAGLHARIAGVSGFLSDPETSIGTEDLREEFAEYAELTQGEALLEVVAADGTVLTQPTARGWTDMVRTVPPSEAPSDARATDWTVGGLPFRAMSARVVSRGRTYVVTVAAPMQSSYAALERFGRLVVFLVPLLLLAAGVTGHWVSRRALVPVDRLTRAVHSITLHSLDERVEVPPADDEVRRLAVTLNDMLERLQHAVGDVVRFTGDAAHELLYAGGAGAEHRRGGAAPAAVG